MNGRVARPPRETSFDEADVDVVACRTGGLGRASAQQEVSTGTRATHGPPELTVVADTKGLFDVIRPVALDRVRRRPGERDERAGRDLVTDRRRVHDTLVGGNPVRVERR
jgi:peptide chain release factor